MTEVQTKDNVPDLNLVAEVSTMNTVDAIHADSYVNDTNTSTKKRGAEDKDVGDETEDEAEASSSSAVSAKKMKTNVAEDYFHMQMPDLSVDENIMHPMETSMEIDQEGNPATKERAAVVRSSHEAADEDDDDEAQGRLEGETIWDERFRMFLQYKHTFG